MKRVTPDSQRAAKPFLKWVGGKRQLLSTLVAKVRRAGDFRTFHEPFLGGGAVFFGLRKEGLLSGPATLSDVNSNLIEAYVAVRHHLDDVIKLLHAHKRKHGKDYYYMVRAEVPSTLVGRAARIIYLNRTCFNGLYRENKKGQFNTPMGRYVDPVICDENNLRAVSAELATANLCADSFELSLSRVEKGDLVYMDPPYIPVSETSYFTAYSKSDFREEEQRVLARACVQLDRLGAKFIASNSDTSFTRELYDAFSIDSIKATRKINSKVEGRGKVGEV
ncbi:MAG: DNA adenine methylase, partial [Chromatiales bacterium]|nr:DNA adenine methylase [Chromatiales bacterium]